MMNLAVGSLYRTAPGENSSVGEGEEEECMWQESAAVWWAGGQGGESEGCGGCWGGKGEPAGVRM